MIRHVLLIKFKTGTSKSKIETLRASFQSMPSKIEGVQSVEWGDNNSPEGKNKDYTHIVLMNFVDDAGREHYLPHPEHDALRILLLPLLEDIIVFDYEV